MPMKCRKPKNLEPQTCFCFLFHLVYLFYLNDRGVYDAGFDSLLMNWFSDELLKVHRNVGFSSISVYLGIAFWPHFLAKPDAT